jgi:chromosome segregation ATPase
MSETTGAVDALQTEQAGKSLAFLEDYIRDLEARMLGHAVELDRARTFAESARSASEECRRGLVRAQDGRNGAIEERDDSRARMEAAYRERDDAVAEVEKLRRMLASAVVWPDDSAPYTGARVRDLLGEVESLKWLYGVEKDAAMAAEEGLEGARAELRRAQEVIAKLRGAPGVSRAFEGEDVPWIAGR